MHFVIDGTERHFVPVKEFRKTYHLPADFGVGLFEAKDYNDLGRIDGAGVCLNELRERVLASLPGKQTVAGWINSLPSIVLSFERELVAINGSIGLRESEIGFAVSGFADVLQNYLFTLMRLRFDGKNLVPSFLHSYGEWLANTTRVSQHVYSYQQWTVQLVTHAYGRCGLIVTTGTDTEYIYDASLGCPVEGFMMRLLSEITAQIAVRV